MLQGNHKRLVAPRIAITLTLLICLASACGGGASPATSDPKDGSATLPDGSLLKDGGNATSDGGNATNDGGNATDDGGTLADGGGVTTSDAGPGSIDGGAANLDGGGPLPDGGGSPDGGSPRKRIFVTGTAYFGDLHRGEGGDGGIARADEICNSSAMVAGLGGTWKAWISAGPSTHAIDRIEDVGPWYLVDGVTKVFENKANLAGSALAPISQRASGGIIVSNGVDDLVWTGTAVGGHATGIDCQGWTTHCAPSNGSMCEATRGHSLKVAEWSETSVLGWCIDLYGLICLEQ